MAESSSATTHPILRIPDDILSTIFEWCILLDTYLDIDGIDGYDSLNVKEGPWYLSHVCQSWRELVISSPRLWSIVSLLFIQYTQKEIESGSLLHRLALQLKRSKALPLIVYLSHELEWDDDDQFISINYLLPLIYPTAHRWYFLEIMGEPETVDDLLGCTFSSLVHLRVWPNLGSHTTLKTIRTFEHTPRLRSLALASAFAVDVPLPWRNITQFECSGDSILDIAKLVNVQEIHVSDQRVVPCTAKVLERLKKSSPISLGALRVLHVRESVDPLIPGILQVMHAPNLRKLDMSLDDNNTAFPSAYVAERLIELHVYRRGFPPDLAPNPHVEFLRHANRLEILSLSVQLVSKKVLGAMAAQPTSDEERIFLPQLRVFKVSPTTMQRFPKSMLAVEALRQTTNTPFVVKIDKAMG